MTSDTQSESWKHSPSFSNFDSFGGPRLDSSARTHPADVALMLTDCAVHTSSTTVRTAAPSSLTKWQWTVETHTNTHRNCYDTVTDGKKTVAVVRDT